MTDDYTPTNGTAPPPRATKSIRVDEETYEKIRQSAATERRNLTNQLAVLVDRGLTAAHEA